MPHSVDPGLVERLTAFSIDRSTFELSTDGARKAVAELERAAKLAGEAATEIAALRAERDFEASSRLTSEAQLGVQIENLLRDKANLRASLAEALEVIRLGLGATATKLLVFNIRGREILEKHNG